MSKKKTAKQSHGKSAGASRAGRPRTTGTQPKRQVGRCGDDTWAIVEKAAGLAGIPVATWALQVIVAEARRQVGE